MSSREIMFKRYRRVGIDTYTNASTTEISLLVVYLLISLLLISDPVCLCGSPELISVLHALVAAPI